MNRINRLRIVLVVTIISILCIVPIPIRAQSAMERCPDVSIMEFVISDSENRGTEYDSDTKNDAYGVFAVTVSGNYQSGQSYFYSVHHTASITHKSPYWYDVVFTWYSDQYVENDNADDIVDDLSDSYDYSTTPYTTYAGTYMRVRIYWWVILVTTYTDTINSRNGVGVSQTPHSIIITSYL